jgi:diacylglycerol O-acyltransferase
MPSKLLAFQDHAWLRMEAPENLMIITGLMTFSKPIDCERLKIHLETSLLRFDRFGQRIVMPPLPLLRPRWEKVRDFDIEEQFEVLQLTPGAGESGLQEKISEIMKTPLDTSRPLWRFYLVENYGPGGALIARLHHVMADGISLMQVLLSLTEISPGAGELRHPPQTLKSNGFSLSSLSPEDFLSEGFRVISDPDHRRRRVLEGAQTAFDVSLALTRVVMRMPDPNTPFRGKLGIEKSCGWTRPLLLEDVKRIGQAFGATVNDVMISSIAGALGRYLEKSTPLKANERLRAVIPVNMRPFQADEQLGNKFGMLFLSLPLGVQDSVKRLEFVKREMDGLKDSAEPMATYGLTRLLGAVPERLEHFATDFFDSKATLVITNVPGPQTQLFLVGTPIETIMGWVPQSGHLGLGISIISYNGKIWLGVAADKGLLPDPGKLAEFFDEEFTQLLRRSSEEPVMKTPLQEAMDRLDKAIAELDERLAEEPTEPISEDSAAAPAPTLDEPERLMVSPQPETIPEKPVERTKKKEKHKKKQTSPPHWWPEYEPPPAAQPAEVKMMENSINLADESLPVDDTPLVEETKPVDPTRPEEDTSSAESTPTNPPLPVLPKPLPTYVPPKPKKNRKKSS